MDNLYEMIICNQKEEIKKIEECNEKTALFGVALTKEEIEMLVESKQEILKETQRFEFGRGILPDLLIEFCDSEYIDQNNYAEVICQLQEVFYTYKNDMQDQITDLELLDLMRYTFENVCFGDIGLLESLYLDEYARKVRFEGEEAFKRGTKEAILKRRDFKQEVIDEE